MNPLKIATLSLFAPRFWREMPKPSAGRYTVQVETFSPFKSTLRHEVFVCGRLRAYVTARWLALCVDWSTPSHGGMLGVRWAILISNSNPTA